MLLTKDRNATGHTAPAHGLFLQWIKFRESTAASAQPADAGAEE